MEFGSTTGEQEYAALVRAADDLVIGLDFDGTLAPIVDDPEQAHIHPDAADVLVELAEQVRAVAVITGRPARQALALGGLEDVGNAIGEHGRELFVLGQYGNERWTSTNRRVISPKPPRGLASFTAGLPRLLRRGEADEAWVEEKGLAVAVHTRRLEDPQAAYERLLPLLEESAKSHDLDVEPGRNVIEVRAHGMHKGAAVHRLVEELGAKAVAFIGDDLGDVEAFRAVEELRGQGYPGCSSARPPTRRTRWPSSPTWWSAARPACSTCCASWSPTSAPPAPRRLLRRVPSSRMVHGSTESTTRWLGCQGSSASVRRTTSTGLGLDRQHDPVAVLQRPTEYDETGVDQLVHERGVLRPAGLLLQRERGIVRRAGAVQRDEEQPHPPTVAAATDSLLRSETGRPESRDGCAHSETPT